MSTNLPFPLADFYDALVSKNVKQKLDPFIAQFRKKNTYIIYECVNRLIQIITNKSELPIMKFNSLMAVRYFFDTCEYAAITLIQIYMLPVIYQIALEKYLKRSQEGMELYFVDRGAQNTKEIRRLGLNYVQLAAEFIFNCAKVKPYRLIENKELKEESNFSRTVKVLNNKGIQQAQKCIYYFPSYPIQTRKKFMKKLKHLSPEPYISFIISEYLEEINLNKKSDLDIKKLLLFGDAFLTSTIVEIIEEELSKMHQNFVNKKKYLNLLNDLIRSGEIESIYLVNTTEFVRQIAEEIGKVKGELGPSQGDYIFPKIQASKQQKKEFYIEFLRVLEIWAFCMPVTDQGEQSQVLRIYEDLKKKNFMFPKNVILSKIKKEMDENLLMNQERNETLMRIIDQDDRASSRNFGSYVSSKGEFKFHFPEYKEKASYLELDELQYKVFETKKKIARLTINKEELQENIEFIENFNENWEEDLEKLDIEDEDPNELQILVDEGDLCCQQFDKVLPIYELYSQGKLTFDSFVKKIEFLQHYDENQSRQESQNHSQVSQDNKMFQSHQKQSSMSQSVRKHIQDEYFTQYGHHYQKLDKSISVKNNNVMMEQVKSPSGKNVKFAQQLEQSKSQSEDQSEDENFKSKVSNRGDLNHQKSKNSSKQSSDIKSSQKMSQSRRQIHRQPQPVLQQNAPSSQQKLSMKNAIKQNLYSNPLKQSTVQKFNKESQHSQISDSSEEEGSNSSYEKQSEKEEHKPKMEKKIQFRTEKQRSPPIAFQSSGSDFKLQTNQKNSTNKIPIPPSEHQKVRSPHKKSVIKHSVISKSSYHSQPTQPKVTQSGYNEGNSMMNDYEIDNVQIIQTNPNNAGITIKKSSIKRTQNSGLKSSSHKRIQQTPSKSPQQIVNDAVSPFKKKKSSLSKDVRIKQSYLKEFQFIKSPKKQQTNRRFNENEREQVTYDEVFRRKDDFDNDASRNGDSEVSSESESVVKRRTDKQRVKEAMRQTARINLNDQSEYYDDDNNRSNSSVLKRSKDHKLKSSSRTPVKTPTKNNLILFDTKHSSPSKKLAIEKVHEEYDIKVEDTKIKHLTDKISEFSKNASKFATGSKVKSGIKLISKNDHKSFDSLYKNEYNNQFGGGQSNVGSRRYQEVTSQYNQALSRTKGFHHQSNPQANSLSPQQKSSVIQNPDYSPVSLKQINEEIQRYKNRPRNHNDHHDISQIHEPENMPMLYSYCSQKSIHSKMTDSHTRKGASSNYKDFRACFLNMDKEVLPLNLTKSKAVSSSFSLDKAKNFIDFRCSNAKSSSKVNTVVDAISEKNAKNSILLYKLEREKTRLVENLQNKIKQLEVNGKMMKTKFAVKDQSVRENIESRQYSQRELKQYHPDTKTSRQSSNQNISLSNYDLLKNSKHPNDLLPTSDLNLQNLLISHPQSSTTINTKPYDPFFHRFLSTTPKKALHKKKGLLIKNDEIEIGYMVSRKDKHVIVSVFITPYLSAIKNVKVEVECDHGLVAKVKPGSFDVIEAKKQEIVMCSFTVQNVPFGLPLVRIGFDQSRSYKKNSYALGLPCTILSFSDMNAEETQQNTTNSKILTYHTPIFKLSKKLTKPQKLKQILPSFKQQSTGQNKVSKFQGIIKYQSHSFCVSIGLSDNGYAVIEAWENDAKDNERQEKSGGKFVEYLLATVRFMLEEEDSGEVGK